MQLALHREQQARRSDTFPPQGQCLCPGLAAEPPLTGSPGPSETPAAGERSRSFLCPGTSFRGAPTLETGTTAAGRAGPARRAQERGSLGRRNPTCSSVLHQRLPPARPPPHGGRGRHCSPAEDPAALPAHATQRAAGPAPFVFLNHAAAPALRPISSAAAPPANGGGPRGFLNRPSPPIAAQRAPPSPAPRPPHHNRFQRV